MSLELSVEHRDAIRRHAERSYPNECCGFLLGTARGDAKRVLELAGADNERTDSARDRYLISPAAYLAAEREADRRGIDIVGFYHSHPDAPARPSEFDRAHALPWCSYIIVAVDRGFPRELTSWVLTADYGRFDPEELL